MQQNCSIVASWVGCTDDKSKLVIVDKLRTLVKS